MGRSTKQQEMPPVSTLTDQAVKVGMLKKLSGKGILTSGTWRDRFCLLVKNKLYFYESEESVGGSDKNCGFVNLEYFDTCTEASTRMAKKSVKNVFVIGSSDKGFFDSHSGRHYFAAETVPEMKEWVNSISSAMKSHIRIKEKRTKRDGSLTPGQTKKENSVKMSKESDSTNGTLPRSNCVKLDHVTKGRVKGPQGRRLPRKPQRPSNGSDSRADSALDYDDEIAVIRDSRGRATSLSALEASSETHPKTSNCNGTGSPKSKEIHTETENKQMEIFNDNLDNFEMDGSETPDIELIYDYSSSDDQSDDDKKYHLTPSEKTSYIQRRPISRAGSHIRNSSVTPPPCILRKNRREQETGNAPNSCGFTGDNSHEQSPSPIFSELMSGLTRASSGSSLSTLTADTYSQITNSNFMNGGPFLSLQRKSKKANGGCIGNGFNGTQSSYVKPDGLNHRQVASANASPILSHGHQHHSSSMLMHHTIKQNGHNNSPNNTFDGNINNFRNTGNDSLLERRLFSLTKDLQSMTVEVKQLDITISGIHQDVGTTQENIVSVKGSIECMKDKVNKIQSQVYNIEKQVASITQEASLIHGQAHEILQSINSVRDEQNNLLEEAKSLVGFLRQSVNCLPATSYMHQHFNAHFGQTNNCCSPSPCSTPVPPTFYSSMQQQPQSIRRRGKTPERTIGCEEINNTDNSNGEYFDSLKTRNTKSAMSNSSSGSSSGSSSSANRVSVAVESIERKTGQLLKSPIINSEAKISHL